MQNKRIAHIHHGTKYNNAQRGNKSNSFHMHIRYGPILLHKVFIQIIQNIVSWQIQLARQSDKIKSGSVPTISSIPNYQFSAYVPIAYEVMQYLYLEAIKSYFSLNTLVDKWNSDGMW